MNLYGDALEELLNDPAGPVGSVVAELSMEATSIASALAPVITGGTSWPPSNYSRWGKRFNPEFQYGLSPGSTKKSVHWSGFRFNGLGQVYSGVNVNFGPTLFLEDGGGRYGHARLHPFMTTALLGVQL